MALLFVCCILFFEAVDSSSVIDAVYVVASYTYGPLLGLFAFGLFTRRMPRGRAVPWVCTAAPMCCYLLDACTTSAFGYRFGYELLMLNGLLTFLGLLAVSRRRGRSGRSPRGKKGRETQLAAASLPRLGYFSCFPSEKACPTFFADFQVGVVEGVERDGATFSTSTLPSASRARSSTLTLTISPRRIHVSGL